MATSMAYGSCQAMDWMPATAATYTTAAATLDPFTQSAGPGIELTPSRCSQIPNPLHHGRDSSKGNFWHKGIRFSTIHVATGNNFFFASKMDTQWVNYVNLLKEFGSVCFRLYGQKNVIQKDKRGENKTV